MNAKLHTGFTLVELMITVVIAAILVSLAVPSFQGMIQNNRFTTQANGFLTAMTYARSEAVKRGVNVRVSATDASDNANEWGPGWTVWVDLDGDSTLDAGEALLVAEALDGGNVLDSTGGNSQFQYLPSGFVNSADTLKLCRDSTGEAGRQISVNLTGRVSVASLTCNP